MDFRTGTRDRTRLIEWRKQRIAYGLCPQCCEPAGEYVTCQRCRQKRADNSAKRHTKQKRRAKWRANNAKHAEAHARRKVEIKEERRTAGLCTKCGLVPVTVYLTCLECRNKAAERRKVK